MSNEEESRVVIWSNNGLSLPQGAIRRYVAHYMQHNIRRRGLDSLWWAIMLGRKSICRFLIRQIPEDEIRGSGYLISRVNDRSICKLLIKHKVGGYDEALRLAAEDGRDSICQLLLEMDPKLAKEISPYYPEEITRVFQMYGDHDAIRGTLASLSERELDLIAPHFVHRKSAQ